MKQRVTGKNTTPISTEKTHIMEMRKLKNASGAEGRKDRMLNIVGE